MIIVWRGLGFLVPLAAFLSLLVSAKFPGHPQLSGGIALLVSASGLWPMGVKLNREAKLHTLFWLPMQYWAIVLGVFGTLLTLTGLRGGT